MKNKVKKLVRFLWNTIKKDKENIIKVLIRFLIKKLLEGLIYLTLHTIY